MRERASAAMFSDPLMCCMVVVNCASDELGVESDDPNGCRGRTRGACGL